MKLLNVFKLVVFLMVGASVSTANNQTVQSLEDYNSLLPSWGVSWSPGAKSINGYYQTFYTGFAMRSEFPERIHVRVARGNQTRITVILDEQTLMDYPFDLVKRADFYQRMTKGSGARLSIAPSGSSFLPQLEYFQQIVDSPKYGIRDFAERARRGEVSREQMVKKGLELLTELNPGRVFQLRIDLNREFSKWRKDMLDATGGDPAKILNQSHSTVAAINTLLFGRINITEQPSAAIKAQLQETLQLAFNGPDEAFQKAALRLFQSVTGSKYKIQTLDSNGRLAPALRCGNSCVLSYPEFTAIYPTGSAMSTTRDEHGNSINAFATPGLWQFLSRGSRHDVDNIRNEPYYGWVPKMDYEAIGNGFHNPAVRFYGVSKDLKSALNIQLSHNTLWAVKRGGVSSGCLRLPLGHTWEMRHIFPVSNAKMTKVMFFGNHSQDFDLYDIDGDGDLEVMGVEYMISYGLQGTSGLAKREGSSLQINADQKRGFYEKLYGRNHVFRIDRNGQYLFQNPKVSFPSYLDFKQKKVSTRLTLKGEYPLFEQGYERDKVQFYAIGEMTPYNKLIVRLMGRVRGCSPLSDKSTCGEGDFDKEMRGLLK